MKNKITGKTATFRLAPLLVASIIIPTINYADDGSLFIEEVTIIGEKITGDQVSGSAHYIGAS